MVYVPQIFDWRVKVEPIDQVFHAGGTSTPGGMTLGGISVANPEPGGRASLEMNFARFANEDANLDASWTISRICNGAVLRIPLYTPSVQLVSAANADIVASVTWDSAKLWSGGIAWLSESSAAVTVAGAKGGETVTVNLQPYGQVLKIGHVIGFCGSGSEAAHIVMDISYSATDRAALTLSPPLRRAVTTSDRMTFRPKILAVCLNPDEVRSNFRWGQTVQLNTARFVEFLA